MNAPNFISIGIGTLALTVATSASPTTTQIAYDVGLDPIGMSVAGLEGDEALDALNQMAAADSLHTTLASQLAAADSYLATITELKALLFERYSESDATQLAAAESNLASTLSNIADTRAAIRIVGLAGLLQSKIDDAQTCLATRAYSVLPKHRLLSLPASEWVELESACRAKAIADAIGGDADADTAALLADFELEPEVGDAALNYATFQSIVESAFSVAEE
jgi:hypothetical protein